MSEGGGLAPGPGCSTEHPSAGASPRPSSEVPAPAPASLRAPGVPPSKPFAPGPQRARAARGAVGAHGPPGARAVSERGQAAGNFSPRSRRLLPHRPPPALPAREGTAFPRGPATPEVRGQGLVPAPWAPPSPAAALGRRGAERGAAGRERAKERPVRRPSAGARRGRRGPPSFLPGRGPAAAAPPTPMAAWTRAAKSCSARTPGP